MEDIDKLDLVDDKPILLSTKNKPKLFCCN